jgi:AcrR family transcriptional regulator
MSDFQFLDKRVQRTKIDFYKALFNLLKQKSFSAITIKELIESARYSRGTFYAHYTSKEELLQEVIDNLFKEMRIAYRGSYKNDDLININELVDEPDKFLYHFKEHAFFYQILLGNNISINFRSLLTDEIIQLYLDDFEIEEQGNVKAVDNELFNRYSAYGLSGLIIEWIINDFPDSPKEFSLKLVMLFRFSMEHVKLKNKNVRKEKTHRFL